MLKWMVFIIAVLGCRGAVTPRSSVSISRELVSLTLRPLVLIGSLVYSTNIKSSHAQSPDSATEIREKYVYEKPDDFLSYLDSCVSTKEGGNFDEVVAAMDKFAVVYPMYALSPAKVKFLQELVVQTKPSRILEIGSFFGYSAIHIINAMGPKARLTCIEGNEENAKVAQAVLNKAFGANSEVLSRVNIITSLSTPVLSRGSLQDVTGSENTLLDFVFLDHDKSFLLPDLKLLDRAGWLSDACTVVADNVLFPGAPDYLEYVNAPGSLGLGDGTASRWVTTLHPFLFERVGFETHFKAKDDAISVSTRAP
jgi:predicted O-methyltransferase YrrM